MCEYKASVMKYQTWTFNEAEVKYKQVYIHMYTEFSVFVSLAQMHFTKSKAK